MSLHSCPQCKRAKVLQHTVTPLHTFATRDAQFDHVHIEVVGPLPPCKGYSCLLICVDHFTRWPEAIPISDITTARIVHTFVSGWIACFGVPSTVTTNCGSQFKSNLWQQLICLLGFVRIRTVFYPSANGLVELFHLQLKAGLMTHGPRMQ